MRLNSTQVITHGDSTQRLGSTDSPTVPMPTAYTVWLVTRQQTAYTVWLVTRQQTAYNVWLVTRQQTAYTVWLVSVLIIF